MSRPASSANPAPSRKQSVIWLILLCFALWLPGFFTLPPTDRDESRFAQASKQMIETGDFVRIMNGTEPRNRKPIGIYWAQVPFAAAARAIGVARANPIWPYRLPSLLGALLAVLSVAVGGRILVGARAAWLAGAWLGASLLLVSEAHIAKTDAALLGVTTAAMLLLARAYLLPEKFTRGHAWGFWALLAAGILLKGPITPMVAGVAILALGFTKGGWRWLGGLRPVSGVLLMILLVLPWFVAIELATKGAFFAQSVGGDLAGKVAGGDNGHGRPFGTYLALLPLLAFPASYPVLRAVPAVWRERRQARVAFLLAWLLPNWLIFEIVPTKLPHYTLPLYPALFLLAAGALEHVSPAWWRRVAWGVGLIGVLGLAAGAMIGPVSLHLSWRLGLPAALALLLAGGLMLAGRGVLAVMAMPLALVALFHYELPRLTPLGVSSRLQASLVAHHLSGLPLAGSGYDEPSLMFLAGTNAAWYRDGDLAGRWLLGHPGGVVVIESRELAKFLQTDPAAVKRDEVDGLNYSNGRWVKVGIYQ